MPVTELTPRFHEALAFASAHFHGRGRPNTKVPGIAHAMAVAALVIDLAEDEDEAIAALLHDVVEDGGGLDALDEIHRRWGRAVADLVAACSDELVPTERSWRERKADDLLGYPAKSAAALRISLADKTDNTHTLLRALELEGEALFVRHAAGDRATFLWYYGAHSRRSSSARTISGRAAAHFWGSFDTPSRNLRRSRHGWPVACRT